MHIAQALNVLRARLGIVIATLLATVGVTLFVSLLLPKSYRATSTIVLNYKGTDPVTGFTLPAQLVPGFMATQIDVIKSENVARRVIEHLRLLGQADRSRGPAGAGDDAVNRLARELADTVEVIPARESSVVEVSVADSDPQHAARLANAFVAAYQQASLQLKVEPLRKASVYFDEQIKKLHSNYEAAQARLAAYQRDKGIVSADRQYDIETARLSDLSTQLAQAQVQLREASLRLDQVKDASASVAPEVINNPLVHSLSNALALAQARFADVAQKLGPAHPAYRSAKADMERLQDSLVASKSDIAASLQNNVGVLRQREADLRAALDQQTRRVLELNFARGEMAVMTRELENAQRIYELASQRYAQINLEGKSDLSDIAVLNPATAPVSAANPRIWRNAVFSMLIGLLLGCGFAMLAEMLDKKVRTADDLANVLGAPVLGTVAWYGTTSRSRALPLFRWLKPAPELATDR